MDAESFNVAIIRGVCSSPPELRVLPSDQRLAQLQLTTRVDGRAMSVPVSVLDPPAWVEGLDAGDELVVLGAVRRRFFRAGGVTASRVEVEAEVVCRGRDRRRSRGLRRRVEEVLEALEA
jgi:single-strand DNA-binding protein